MSPRGGPLTNGRTLKRSPRGAYVEAAANILTNSALDPFGKIPEFKFSAVKVEKTTQVAAE